MTLIGQWEASEIISAVSAIIAFVALFRPEFSYVWRRSRSNMEIHPAGPIEIGFSGFGPTIGLFGVLRPIAYDQFVKASSITIVRDGDGLTHNFLWAVFRPNDLTTQPPSTFQMACGFQVSLGTSHKFNIQYHDQVTLHSMRDAASSLERAWSEWLREKNIALSGMTPANYGLVYAEFNKARQQEVAACWDALNQVFYWREGRYELNIKVETSRPTRSYTYKYGFNLSKQDCERLRLNIIGIMRGICSDPNVVWQFSSVPYLAGK